MRSTNSTKEAIKQWLHVSASPETRVRIWREVLVAQEQSTKAKSDLFRPNLWRTLMKSPLTTLTATTVIIITAVFLITFFDKAATPVYALEQTIEANHTIKTIHLRIIEGGQSIEKDEFSDCWIKYDDAGLVSNFRCNIYEDGEDRAYAVWNEGILKIWRPSQNTVIVIRVNDMEKYWEDFAKEYDPKLIFRWLYVSRGNKTAQLQINELAEEGHSVYVTATHSIDKTRLALVIDPKTKLVKELSRYRLGEQEDELDTRIEVLAYNQAVDPSMFELRGIPEDALVIDQIDQLVGLEQGNLTNNEIVVKVVRQVLEATVAKDYEKVSRLMEGVPGDTVEEFIKEEFDAKLVRVISIGQPIPHERSTYHIYVPCEIEVENVERGKWTVNIIAMTEFINYQTGRRWVMHCPDKDDGSRISTNGPINAQGGIGEKLIIPGERVGDFRLGISKNEVLKRLGRPKMIFLGEERYTLNNLPNRYYMAFGGISFRIDGDIVKEITAHDPLYKFSNGLGVGDSEQKIKQAFGSNFQLEEFETMIFLTYEDKGLTFEIDKNRRTVEEINVTQAKHNQQSDRGSGKDVLNLVRQAAAEGRIAYKRTTPEEFKQIAGKPTKERVSEDGAGEVVELEYSGVQVKFFGRPDSNTPVTILWIAYDGGNIDIGKDRYKKTVKAPSIQPFDKEQAKNPGLGIRRLHEKGITGRGVRIAILDQKLLVDHQEYAERVRMYEEIELRSRMEPQMHGAAVASIAVGKTVGVAPEAELYYIAKKGGPGYVTQGIDRILEINKQLPKDNKIRVISISVGWTPSTNNYDAIMAACERAKAAGIFVVSCSLDRVYGFQFHGLGRQPSADPDVFESYEPGLWWAKGFYEGTELRGSDCLLVPMDSRTTASPGGKDEYIFHRQGGWSWSVPYIAGVYALAAQVDPDITPERFWNLALKTGRTIELEHNGEKRPFGPIIDPVKLISSISEDAATSQRVPSKNTIVPGVGVGDYMFGMSKDEILKKLGEPEVIQLSEDEYVRRGEKKYNLNNLPRKYVVSFGDISFFIHDDSVGGIIVRSPLYKLSNGLKVGDSEQKIKQALGEDVQLKEDEGKEYLLNDVERLAFEIHKENRTVTEIIVFRPEGDRDAPDQQEQLKGTIVPGVGMGDYTFDMSKDDVLRRLGKPKNIHFGGEDYTLDNLPKRYFMFYDGISFHIDGETVIGIATNSPRYEFANGLKVGDSVEKIKQAFGQDFELQEFDRMDALTYKEKGLRFEIDKESGTVEEINVTQAKRYQRDRDVPDSDKAIMLSEKTSGPITFPKIDRKPKPSRWNRGEMKSLPKYDPDSDNPFQVDLRCRDLSKLDLSNSIDDLLYASFDDRTIWPANDKMPHDFPWQKFMELGKNPGLGVRSLHKKGITGRGVRIAILDQPLLVDHQEYVDRVRLYEEIDLQGETDPAMHGAAVASIAVGKTVGVAPEAELYYIAQWNFDRDKGTDSLQTLARGIHRIVEVNEQLPKDNKIRVISISRGWTRSHKDYKEITEAVQKAQAAGMLIVCPGSEYIHEGLDFGALGRSPLADPEVFESYEPGLFWAKRFWARRSSPSGNSFSVPMDSRTTASPTGIDEYVFYRIGGYSWAVPYIAGLYALAVQADPAITPERFWALAVQSGRTIELKDNGRTRALGPIVDPVRLIRSISDDVGASQQAPSKNTIVPGVRVGNYTLDMSKDDILKELGKPEAIYPIQIEGDEVIRRGEEECSLDSLPEHYILSYRGVSFWMDDDSIEVINVHSPLYKLSNGLGVGDSEQKIKQAFGEDFKVEEAFGKDFRCYHAKGLGFQIREKDRTVAEIVVYRPEGDDRDVDSSRQEVEPQIIVPGVGMGDFTLDMNKDDVLRRLGEPKNIHLGGEDYTLDNLPKRYYMFYDDISFYIVGEAVTGIATHGPRYAFANGLKVGDSRDRIVQTFGKDFKLTELERIDILTYEDKGLYFEIDKENGTVEEISVNRAKRNQSNINIPKVQRRDEIGPYEDVSGKDLRGSDLRYSEDILDTLEFNQETQWPPPERLPEGFDPKTLLQEGMNPGLGIRALHAQGITGAGVHVGLIDQPLLLDHPEYAGKIVSYHAIDCGSNKSSMHGPAMASQLVGERCGTAPGASLRVVAVPSWKADAGYYAQALDRFVAYNENAPKEQKIRVVSVSCQPSGEGSVFKNQSLWDEAVRRAEAQGILVLDCTWHNGFVSLCWLDPQSRESVEACTPGFRLGEVEVDEGHIHVPSAPRTAARADEDGSFGYAYDGGGRRSRRPKAKNGYSDTIPYAAGVLALGWQVRPDLSPAQMKELLFASAYMHESGAKIINPTAFIDLVRGQSSQSISDGVCKEDSETRTIVPGVGVGDYKLSMSKDDVLKKLGEPETIQFGDDEVIRRGQKKYNLNDLPREYILSFGDVSFWFEDNSVQVIVVHTPLYKLSNDLGVGDSEQKIKQAFGEDSDLEEARDKEVRWYQTKGIGFEIHKKNRTVAGIYIYRDVQDSAEAALVRKAAADGLIAYKLTTPDEFKAIVGKPAGEWTASGDDEIYLKYPGIRARFFGQQDQTPHTLISIWCEGRGIDIGQDRPIVLRHEGDLDKLGSFSNIDLSRLDLSQQGEIVKATTFDSLTVWPPSDRLPSNFDPVKRLEWGKNPGLGIRSLHREGITGKGVGIAIIDQPLLRDHVEYADRMKSYHEIEVEGVGVMGHGSPVCGIAVGKTCGVAPEASLHYYACAPWRWRDNRPYVKTVEQIVERNQDLSPSEKVRVISISSGLFSKMDYFDQWKSAVKKAHENGILVVTCSHHFLRCVTLERLAGTDPDDPNNYSFASGVHALYVPAGNWSIASSRGKEVYTFDTRGANSWTVPYLAGLAAMAFQVHPEMSPDRIVTLFQETATQTKQGRVINPRGFVEAVKRLKLSK